MNTQIKTKIEFVQKLYAELCIKFPAPQYSVIIRGSWAVYLLGLVHNDNPKNSNNQIDLNSICPDDFDIYLCYKTNKHDTKLDDSIKNISINIDNKIINFLTEQKNCSSKTFVSTSPDALINSIDIVRGCCLPLSTSKYESCMVETPKKLFDEYQGNKPEYHNNMTDEERKLKYNRHCNKREIMGKIVKSNSVDVIDVNDVNDVNDFNTPNRFNTANDDTYTTNNLFKRKLFDFDEDNNGQFETNKNLFKVSLFGVADDDNHLFI